MPLPPWNLTDETGPQGCSVYLFRRCGCYMNAPRKERVRSNILVTFRPAPFGRNTKKNGRPKDGRPSSQLLECLLSRLVKVEQVKQVADRRAVEWHVRADKVQRERVGEVIAAALRNRRQIPVALDELEDRNVIRVIVRDVSRLQVRAHNQEENARAVAEEVQRLHVSRIVVTAA